MNMAEIIDLKKTIESLIGTLTKAHQLCAVPADIAKLRTDIHKARETAYIARAQSVHAKTDRDKLDLHVALSTADEFVEKGVTELEARLLEEEKNRAQFRQDIGLAVYRLQELEPSIADVQKDNATMRKLLTSVASSFAPEYAAAKKKASALGDVINAVEHLKRN
jgi:hypothetical protein